MIYLCKSLFSFVSSKIALVACSIFPPPPASPNSSTLILVSLITSKCWKIAGSCLLLKEIYSID